MELLYVLFAQDRFAPRETDTVVGGTQIQQRCAERGLWQLRQPVGHCDSGPAVEGVEEQRRKWKMIR